MDLFQSYKTQSAEIFEDPKISIRGQGQTHPM
jgi:hypothetical protein